MATENFGIQEYTENEVKYDGIVSTKDGSSVKMGCPELWTLIYVMCVILK